MRSSVVAVAMLIGVLAGCSGEPEPAPATKAAQKPSETATTMAPDRLADLSKAAEGKILLRHADAKAADFRWTGRFIAEKGYRLHLDCIPGETPGDMVVKVGENAYTGGCEEEQAMREVSTPDEPRKAYPISVEVPPGAKWAVLVEAMPTTS